MARSINQNAYSGALPNFRNLGIMLRILLMGNAAAAAAAVVKGPDLLGAWREFVESAALVEPLLVLSVLALAVLSGVLRLLPYWLGVAAVLALELVLTAALYFEGRALLGQAPAPLERYSCSSCSPPSQCSPTSTCAGARSHRRCRKRGCRRFRRASAPTFSSTASTRCCR